MLNEILEKNDIRWYKNWCITRNKKEGSYILYILTFHTSTFSNLVDGIPCSLILSIKNGEDGRGGGGYLKSEIC